MCSKSIEQNYPPLHFIKIKNGSNFVEKKYVGESMVDDAKLTIINEEQAVDILGVEVLNI